MFDDNDLREDFRPTLASDAKRFEYYDLDLTNARSDVELNLKGFNFLYIAKNAFDSETIYSATRTVGQALIRLGSISAAPLPLEKGTVYRIPNTGKVYVTNAAQALKMQRWIMSTGPTVVPTGA